jgi:hypothetical protein
VARWGRRNLLSDDVPRDLGVPRDQLALQRQREAEYFSNRVGPGRMAAELAVEAERPEVGEPSA